MPLKAGLIEVVDVVVGNTIFAFCVLYKLEPGFNFIGVFAERPLVVVYSIEGGFEGWLTLGKVVWPTVSDCEEKIAHLLHHTHPGREPT